MPVRSTCRQGDGTYGGRGGRDLSDLVRLTHVLRGDGRLTHELDPDSPGPRDECGVFGVYAPNEEVSKLTYYGLFALQHRGQESAGIAVSNGNRIMVFKDMGLVSQVFDESTLASLTGHLAIGHTRYSTTGREHLEERAADVPVAGERQPRAGAQRQHHEHRRARGAAARTGLHRARAAQGEPRLDQRHVAGERAAGHVQRQDGPRGRARPAAPADRRVLPGLHDREGAVRGPRPAGHPPARPRAPGERLGRRLGDRGPRHRRRDVHA